MIFEDLSNLEALNWFENSVQQLIQLEGPVKNSPGKQPSVLWFLCMCEILKNYLKNIKYIHQIISYTEWIYPTHSNVSLTG